MKPYVCSICGKSNVKLWRPNMKTEPLICAKCAEERQSSLKYKECIWQKEYEHSYIGHLTGKELPLPRWEVDELGRVPSYDGPGPEDTPKSMTFDLIVDLNDNKETLMIPAIPCENGDFLKADLMFISPKTRNWWFNLPIK